MCLSVAVDSPDYVLNSGVHAGYQWTVTRTSMGFRCGYVRVPAGHPWHGKTVNQLSLLPKHYPMAHGGINFSDADKDCGGGPDDGWWIGFDCQHVGDLPDLEIADQHYKEYARLIFGGHYEGKWSVKDQAYVETWCRRLCEQAKAADFDAEPRRYSRLTSWFAGDC